MSDACIFCRLREERIISQCDLTTTFIDSYPASPGHTLIITKRHVANFFEVTEKEQNAIAKALQKAKIIIDKEFSPDGYNIGINNGESAGQSIMHLHVHLIPRYQGDVENPKGGVRWVIKNKADYWS